MADVFFEVGADFSQAVKEIAGFSKQAASSAKSIESAFAGVGVAIAGVFAGVGVGKLFKEIVDAGLEAEKSNKKLTAALRLTGDATKENVAAFKEYADTLSIQTGIDDDLIVSNVAFLKSLGATNEQTKQIIKTATDLSAAFGQDLGTSVDQLAKTFQGSAGALGKFIPGLNNLTKAQLSAGAGIELVSKQFAGLAGQNVQGVAGAITVLELSFSNLGKTLGSKILESPVIAQTINAISKGIRELTAEIDKLNFNDFVAAATRLVAVGTGLIIFNSLPAIFAAVGSALGLLSGGFNLARIAALGLQSVLSFGLAFAIDQFVKLTFEVGGFTNALEVTGAYIVRFFVGIGASVLSVFAQAFEAITQIPGGIGEAFAGVSNSIGSAAQAANNQYDSLTGTINNAYKAADGTAKATREIATETGNASTQAKGLQRNFADARSEIESAVKSLKGELQKAAFTQSEQLATEFKERVALINKAKRLDILNSKEASELRLQAETAAINAAAKIQKEADDGRLDQLSKQAQVLAQNPFGLLFGTSGNKPIELSLQEQTGVGLAGGLAQAAGSGEGGFAKLVSGAAGAFADSFIPGLGAIVRPIIDALTGGAEKTREFFDTLIKEIPTVIENIILSIPELLKAVVSSFGEVLDGLIEKIPDAVFAIIEDLPDLLFSLIEGMINNVLSFMVRLPLAAVEFVFRLIGEIPKIVVSFINAIIKEVPRLITEVIKALVQAIGGAFGGIAKGVGGFFGGVGSIFGFADGGRIPNIPSLQGDRGLTRVDAGEQIFSRDLTSQLEQFLAGQAQGSSQPMQVNLTIGTEQLASALFQVNRQGWRTA